MILTLVHLKFPNVRVMKTFKKQSIATATVHVFG
jgi:hypothetical protein